MAQRYATTGTITTQDLSPAGNTPTPGSFVQLPQWEAAPTFLSFDEQVTHVDIGVAGTYTGALNINGTEDGVEWFVLGNYPAVNQETGVQTENIPSGATGLYTVNVVGMRAIRVDGPGAMTGAAVISMNSSDSEIAPRGAVNPTSLGAQTASIPANSADVVVSALPGELVSIEVVTSGSAATNIYDNASAGSGKLVFSVPASAAVGSIYQLSEVVANGITIHGTANTSGLVIKFD